MAAKSKLSVHELGELDESEFVARLGEIYEKSPWVVREATSPRTRGAR